MSPTHHSTCGKKAHLTQTEREFIERQLRMGTAKKQIARLLGRDIRTIRREIKRGSVEQRKSNPYMSRNPCVSEFVSYTAYFSDVGQRRYEANRQRCGPRYKLAACHELVRYIEDRVLGPQRWSPDAAVGYAKLHGLFPVMVSTKTVYNWIDDGLLRIKNVDLLYKVRRRPRKPRQERKRILGRSIDERPRESADRVEFGHWEGDGIVGKNQNGQLITLVERKTGLGILTNAHDRKSQRIVELLDRLENTTSGHFREVFKTITFDNGPEFASSADMERNGRTRVYYAHPYSAFERPVNENWNGMVRRFIPKGSSFQDLSDDMLERIAFFINTIPRKRLGYETPLQLWHEHFDAIVSS